MAEDYNKIIDESDLLGIVRHVHQDPFRALGKRMTKNGLFVSCYFPGADDVNVRFLSGTEQKMDRVWDEGIFVATVPAKLKDTHYEYVVTYPDGNTYSAADPYEFEGNIPEEELEKFSNGINYEIYKYLGSHVMEISGVKGTRFAVWAPNAAAVSVVANFNGWDGRRFLMKRDDKHGVFELFIPGVGEGEVYKYEIVATDGTKVLKADPYGTSAEKRPANASVVCSIEGYKWTDASFLASRAEKDLKTSPMSIYEVHLGSWKKPSEEDGDFYSYREIAPMLAKYVKDMGYTHIELLPVMEHPFDGSWGYQVTGYYAPTSRFGKPADFMYFVDTMHKNGISVILDWVPAHFPKDAFGLAKFDGTCLYEHADPRQGEHPHWGTLIYNYRRPEVSNFLIANALYWVEQYHIDGIRMDAVASMLYLDYGKNSGEWVANCYGGNENLDAIELLKHLNSIMEKRNKNVAMIAEESTAWPMVSGKVEDGGLGFNFKWNMGWMNDFLTYIKLDPLFRKGDHNALTFGMMYAYSERFVLVFSHDEVVHGKGSMIGKMPGNYEDQFANLRAAYGFYYSHPGKKLLFMGQEFAQYAEWNENKSLDWMLPEKYEKHAQMQQYVKTLNKLYQKYPAFYQGDCEPSGFEWINCNNAQQSMVSFVRSTTDGKEKLVIVCNFIPVGYEEYEIGVPCMGTYTELINSDSVDFGGNGMVNDKPIKAVEKNWDGRSQVITIKLPPLSFVAFTVKETKKRSTKK